MHKSFQIVRIIAILVAVILLLLLVNAFKGITVQGILSYEPENPFVAFLVLMGFYCLKSVIVVFPITALFISAGIMFPVPLAIAITYLGLILEISIGNFIGRRLGSTGYEKLVHKNKTLGKWLAPSDETFNAVCFITCLLPGPLPLDIMNVLFGATKISYLRHIVFSLLGLSPGMIPWVIAGRAIDTPLSTEFLIPFSIALAVAFIAFLLFQIIFKKEGRNG